MGKVILFIRNIVCLAIKSYQIIISPFLQPCCRFYPSCSQYAVLAITQHGLLQGLWMATLRLLRCHPWSEGGIDLVLSNSKSPNKETL